MTAKFEILRPTIAVPDQDCLTMQQSNVTVIPYVTDSVDRREYLEKTKEGLIEDLCRIALGFGYGFRTAGLYKSMVSGCYYPRIVDGIIIPDASAPPKAIPAFVFEPGDTFGLVANHPGFYTSYGRPKNRSAKNIILYTHRYVRDMWPENREPEQSPITAVQYFNSEGALGRQISPNKGNSYKNTRPVVCLASDQRPETAQLVLLHEVTHAIQELTGQAKSLTEAGRELHAYSVGSVYARYLKKRSGIKDPIGERSIGIDVIRRRHCRPDQPYELTTPMENCLRKFGHHSPVVRSQE
jgi:hypothetical protein